MKKTLLTIAAAMLSVVAFSQTQTWIKSIVAHETTVEFSDWAYNSPIATAADGSVYVTGTFNQDLTIGTDVLSHTGKSAFLAKYANTGDAIWAISLDGAATITAISATADGVVLAGVFADEVIVGSKDGNTQTINGMEENASEVSAFILRYDAAGNLKACKTIVPELNPDLRAIMNTDDPDYPYHMYDPIGGDTYFHPEQIEMVGEKIYLAANYTADEKISDELTLHGKVLNVFDFMYMDISSFAILSLDTDLSNAELIYNVSTSENLSYTQMEPQSLKFAVSNNKVYAAGSGYGTLALSGLQTGTIEFLLDEWEGMTENGMFIIDPDNGLKVFHATPTYRYNTINEISSISVNNGIMNLVGSYSACLPLDNTKTEDSYNETFFANYNLNNQAVSNVYVSGTKKGENEKEIVSGVIYDNGDTLVTTYVFCDKSKNEAIVKGSNLKITEDGMTSSSENCYTAASGNSIDEMYTVFASEGAYYLSPGYNTTETGVASVKANDNAVRKELINGHIYLIRNGERYNLLGVKQE